MRADVGHLAKTVTKTVSRNSPSILTGLGVAGVFSTALLAGRASYKAAEIIINDEMDSGVVEDARERLMLRFKLVWPLYLPAVATGAASVVCIIGANHVSSRRNAALVSLYSLSETAFSEYKEKIVEQLGVNKEEKVRTELAQDAISKTPPSSEILLVGDGKILCRESISGRYFQSDMESIRKVQNDINRTILNDMYVSLNDFYHLLGLSSTTMGEEVGWTSAMTLEIVFTGALSEDGKPVLSIGYQAMPIPNYWKFR